MGTTSWLFFLGCFVTLASCFDLGPILRIAQCRSQCLRKHSTDGTCDWFSSRGETVCSECWQNCDSLENHWEDSRSICDSEQYSRCPACETACVFRQTRVEEKYLPSMLPSPRKGPVSLSKHDVAVVMRRVDKQWKESGYYPGGRTPSLRPDTWIIVVVEDGIKHYSWQEWYPRLESLKQGALFEATISWKDVQQQLKKQQDIEQKRFNDRVRQFFLEKYGEKVLSEWRSQVSEDVFKRFFFRRKDVNVDKPLETEITPSTGNTFLEEDQERLGKKESYVVSWEPETGGLMGNQVTDSNSAQISLLPGIKYLVRIASNEGPGSYPIEVDTRPTYTVNIEKAPQTFDSNYTYYGAIIGATGTVFIVLLIFLTTRKSQWTKEEAVEEVV